MSSQVLTGHKFIYLYHSQFSQILHFPRFLRAHTTKNENNKHPYFQTTRFQEKENNKHNKYNNLNQTQITLIITDDYLIKSIKIGVIHVLLTVTHAQTKHARMENVENMENKKRKQKMQMPLEFVVFFFFLF